MSQLQAKVDALFEAQGIRMVSYSETPMGPLTILRAHPHINDLWTAEEDSVGKLMGTMSALVGEKVWYDADVNSFCAFLKPEHV